MTKSVSGSLSKNRFETCYPKKCEKIILGDNPNCLFGWITDYLQQHSGDAETSHKARTTDLMLFWDFVVEATGTDNITLWTANLSQEYAMWLQRQRSPATKKLWKPRTINRRLAHLAAFVRWALCQDQCPLPAEAIDGIKRLTIEPQPLKRLDAEQIRQLNDYAARSAWNAAKVPADKCHKTNPFKKTDRPIRDYAILLLLQQMSAAEVCRLNVEDNEPGKVILRTPDVVQALVMYATVEYREDAKRSG